MFSENLSSHQQAMLRKINLISIYTMVDGQSRIINYHRKDLCAEKPLEIEGYVSGVVVLCSDQVEAYLDTAVMSKIREERDGTLTCRYFGPLKSKGVLSPYLQSVSPKSPTVNVKTDTGAPKYLPGGYSYFPRVLGDGVSQRENFSILISKGKHFLKIPVRQQGSRTVSEISGSRKKISFYYQGNSRRLATVTDLQGSLLTGTSRVSTW